MKRLLAQIGITYFSVLAVAFYLPDNAVFFLGGAFVILTVVLLLYKKARKTVYLPLMALFALLACAVNIGYTYLSVMPAVSDLAGEGQEVRAVLTDEPYQYYGRTLYPLQTLSVNGKDAAYKLILAAPESISAEVDDTLSFIADVAANEKDNDRSRDYFVITTAVYEKPQVTPAEKHGLYYYAVRLRKAFREALTALLPSDCAALCRTVFVGDKYALGLSVRDDFRFAGASYFVVVSGMHFAVICMLILRLMGRLNRWVRLGLMLAVILIYAAVTGFQPSVTRSALMMLLTVIGMTVRRKTYPPNHLGFAGLVIPLLISPYAAGQISLILSFYATLAILLWANPIAHKLCITNEYDLIYRFHFGAWFSRRARGVLRLFSKKKPKNDRKNPAEPFSLRLFFIKLYNAFAAVISVSLAANLLVFPITVFVFREASLVTLLSAVLLYWAIYLILLLSMAVCILFFTPLRFFAVWLSYPLILLCRYVLGVVGFLGGLPFAYVPVRSAYVYIWLIVSLIMGAAVLLYRDRGRGRLLRLAAFGSVIVLIAGMVTHSLINIGTMDLEVYTEGDGVCIGVNDGGDLHLLYTSAYSKELSALLKKLDLRYGGAQTAYCPDYDAFYQYAVYVDGTFAISRYMLYDKNSYSSGSERVVGFSDDCVLIPDEDLTLSIAVKKSRPVMYITAGEQTVLLLTAGQSVEDVPEPMRQADVILIPRYLEGAEKLRCRDLIIYGSEETAWKTAGELRPCYKNVYLACEGEIRLALNTAAQD